MNIIEYTYFQASPTPIRVNHEYHIQRGDFLKICGGDLTLSATLRVMEVLTTKRIKVLRDALLIPAEQIPPDELLWIAADYKMIADYTKQVRGRSSVERVLNDSGLAGLRERVTLQKLGFVKSRFVAYAKHSWEKCDQVQFEANGTPFVVVLNAQGWMMDAQGEPLTDEQGDVYLASGYGFGSVVKQYLYCIDAVNSALYALDGLVYEPLPRWVPPKPVDGATKNKGTVTVTPETTKSADAQSDQPLSIETSSRNEGDRSLADPGRSEGTTSADAVSTLQDTRNTVATQEVTECAGNNVIQKNDSVAHLHAPLTPETVAVLSHAVLSECQPGVALPSLDSEEWIEEAEGLLHDDPTLVEQISAGHEQWAWESIEVPARYMATDGSPSWWQHRSQPTAITLKHVRKHRKTQVADAKKHGWYPTALIGYEGPRLPGVIASPPLPRVPRMSQDRAEALCREIIVRYPTALVSIARDEGTGRCVVGLQYGIDEYVDFYGWAEWDHPSAEQEALIALAVQWAQGASPPPSEGVAMAPVAD